MSEPSKRPDRGGKKNPRKKKKGARPSQQVADRAASAGPAPIDPRPWLLAGAVALGLGAFTWWAWPPREAPEPHVQRGNQHYSGRRYPEALGEYEAAPGAGPRHTGVHLDRGLARFRVSMPADGGSAFPLLPPDASAPEGLTRAQDEFRTAARGGTTGDEDAVDPFLRARAAYDLGNTFFSQRAWDNAIEAYKSALRLRPGWRDAAWNLELARRLKEEERNPPDAGQDASQDAAQDASQDSGNDGGNDGGGDSGGNDGGGDGGGDSGRGDGGGDSGGNDGGGDAGAGDAGARDSGSEDQGDAGPRDAQAPRSMAPLDDLDRTSRSLQEEMMRRRGIVPRSPDDDR